MRHFDPSSIRAIIGEISDLTDQMDATRRELAEERERDKAAHAAEDEAREAAARRGAFGPEWQRLQQRMDRGETSWEAVFLGLDEDDATKTIVTNSFDRLETMIAEARDTLEDEDSPASAEYLETTQLDTEIRAQLAHIEQELDRIRRTT